jgi:hypothetical protein
MTKFFVTSRSLAASALVAALSFGVGGCNGGDDGGPIVLPTATPSSTTTPNPTTTPASSRFQGKYTGSYRTVTPATGEIGTLQFTVAQDGTFSGTFSSPQAPAPITVTGTVSSAGVVSGSGVGDFGIATSKVTVAGTISQNANRTLSGTFANEIQGTTVRGTIAGSALVAAAQSVYNGAYSGSFINTADTSQNGTVTATVNDGNVTAVIQVPGIGAINGRGVLDFATGTLTLTAPFELQGTGQFLSLRGRVSRSTGNSVVGSGTFASTAGGRGTFRVTKNAG